MPGEEAGYRSGSEVSSLGVRRETALRDILKLISQSRHDETPVFEAILRHASSLCDAPMAALSMISADGKHYEILSQIGARPEFVDYIKDNPPQLDPDRYVVARSILEMRTIAVDDLSDPTLYGASDDVRAKSVSMEGVRSAFYVPLISDGKALGAILLYRRVVAPFSPEDIALVETFAEQAVIAIENVRQFKALERRTTEVQALNAQLEQRVADQVNEIERMGRLKRFLPPAVAEAVVAEGDDQLLRSHRALIATLFADIRGFTAFVESAEPEETIDVLQTYHEAMGELLREHGAGVDQRVGDGIMAIFNDPLPCEDPAGDAVRLALAMRERMVDLCAGWKRLGHRLGFGVGISLGYATVGMVGSEGRQDYAAAGTVVNLAARLSDEAKDGEILLSPRAFAAVESGFEIKPHGEIVVKGLQAPVEVHRVVR